MARRFETILRVKPRDNLGDPQYWNRRFDDIDRRISKNEDDLLNLDEIADRVEGIALERIDQVVTPIVVETIERVRDIPNLFRTTSLTSETIGLGLKSFTIAEGDWNTFAHQDYVYAYVNGDTSKGMVGAVQSYDAVTGVLVFDAEVAWGGSTTHADWKIGATAPADAHANRFDNPHEVTAAQVGAYTTDQVDVAIQAAKDELVGTAGTLVDTLGEIDNKIEANATDAVNTAVAMAIAM